MQTSSASLLVAVSTLLLLAACGDDGSEATRPTNNPSNNPANNPSNNPTNNPSNNPANNPSNNPVTCECKADERCVDGACSDKWDRACAEDGDCRANEVCTEVGPNARACIWQPKAVETCPGSPGCESGAGTLRAGAAKVVTTPVGFEQARRDMVRGAEFIGDPDDPDTFIDCGLDQLCPGDPGYTEPDFGEGDGHMQGAWIAGYDHSRPAFRYCEDEEGGRCPDGQPWAGAPAHDDIHVRALVLERGDVTIAFVVFDAIGMFYGRAASIRALLSETTEVDLMIVGSTHVHEAPDALGQWGPGFGGQELPVSTGAEPWWLSHLDHKAAEAVDTAYATMADAEAHVVQTDTGIAGLAVSDGRDPWIFDDDLSALELTNASTGATIATLWTWGQHAEVMGGDNLYITGDFPGATNRAIEEGLPEIVGETETYPAVPGLGGVALFYSGPAGGLIGPGGAAVETRDGHQFGGHEWEKVDGIGEQLALRVLTSLDGVAPLDDTALRYASKEFIMPIENSQFHVAFMSLELFDRDIYNVTTRIPFSEQNMPAVLTRVTAVRLGPATLVTCPGEPFPEMFVGGFDPSVSYPSTPVVGRPTNECGADYLPLTCASDGECPEGWLCQPHGWCAASAEFRCHEDSECSEGFACTGGRCQHPCDTDDACAESFLCLEGTCRYQPALASGDASYPCLLTPWKVNPPDLDRAPAGPYVKDRVPGDTVFVLTLTHDELGYLVPPYDFEIDPGGPYISEPPGEHYGETNSTGPRAWPIYEENLNDVLDRVGP